MKSMNRWTTLPAAFLALLILAAAPLSAQELDVTGADMRSQSVFVPLYKSRLIALSAPATRVSVGNPDVADILILRATQLYVLGKDLGTTNVLLWDRNDQLIGTIEVEVTHDLQSLKKKLYELLPGEKIEVQSAQRNIILSGKVSNVTSMEAALQIARGYFGSFTAKDTTEFEQDGDRNEESSGQVINLMSVGGVQQVMLEVKVAEIARIKLLQSRLISGVELSTLSAGKPERLALWHRIRCQPAILPAVDERRQLPRRPAILVELGL